MGKKKNCLGKWVPGTRIQANTIEQIPSPENIGPYRNIVIHTGINNLNKRNCKSDIDLGNELESKCKSILDLYPKTRIFLSPVFPTKNYNLNVRVSLLNEQIVAVSSRHNNIIVIDNSVFLDSNTLLLKDEYHCNRGNDLIHLGSYGMRRFAMTIKQYVLGKSQHMMQQLNFRQAFYSSP